MSSTNKSEEEQHGSEPYEAIHFVISDLNSAEDENRVMETLHQRPGVIAVSMIKSVARVSYDPLLTTKDDLFAAIQMDGFSPSIFQDTNTGEKGVSCNGEQIVPEKPEINASDGRQ